MHRRCLIWLGVSLTVLALGQDLYNPARTYVVGEKDVYGLSMKMAMGQYDVQVTGKLSYEVKKALDNGDADVESRAYDMVFTVMGQENKQPGGDSRIVRYNKFGAAIEKGLPKDQRQPIFMKFLTYRAATPMKVGEVVKIDEVLDDEIKTQVKGTAKLESLVDGVAKISSSLDISQAKGNKPTHIDSIGYFDAKTSKLNRAESKVTNVEAGEIPNMPPLQSITIVVERTR